VKGSAGFKSGSKPAKDNGSDLYVKPFCGPIAPDDKEPREEPGFEVVPGKQGANMRNLIKSRLKKLVRSESRYARGRHNATVIAVATVKGGVGKTTTAVNLAAGLAAQHGLRVLLVDLDAQGHCSISLAEVLSEKGEPRTPVHEILLSEDELEVLDACVETTIEGLVITPADPGLADAEGRISQKIGKELLLRDALEITRTHFDVILIDCPPNKGNLTLNALLAADQVLIPTDLSPLSVQGADELIDTVLTVRQRLNHSLEVLGVVLTRVDGRTVTINEEMRQAIEEAWGGLVLQQHIGINTALAQAQMKGEPIFVHAPQSRGAEHYAALSQEVLDRLEQRPAR
jgi:chromosome partitioning protein